MQRDRGLLLLRVGIGLMFMAHGWPKLSGGPGVWTRLGGAMATFGIDFAPAAWGLLAAVSEFGGGLLLATGLFFRHASAALLATMLVAASMHLGRGDPFSKTSHSIEAAILFASLLWIGPGRHVLRIGRRAK